MTTTAKILIGILLAAAIGSTAWYLHTPTLINQQGNATSTSPGSDISTTTTSTTVRNSKPPVVKTPTPKPATTIALSSISPSKGPVGTNVRMVGKGFTKTSQVMVGTNAAVSNVTVNTDGTVLTFTMPSSTSAYCVAQEPCPMYAILLRPGTYQLSVRNTDGSMSKTIPFTLTSSDSL